MTDMQKQRHALSAGEMAFVDWGEGPPVLLLHGFPTSSALWRREIPLLAQGMRVIAPDLLGYGESDKPVDADLSEPAQAGYVRELLQHLGVEEAAVVGHDIGGAIGQMLALDGPLDVATLILMDSACFDAWPVEGVKLIQGVVPEQETAAFVEDILRATFVIGVKHQDLFEEDSLQGYLRPWLDDPGAFFRAARGLSGNGLAGRDDELSALDTPVFLLWGEEDPFLPVDLAERLNDLLQGSTLAMLPGCSHFITDDAPHTIGPLIFEYLRSRYLGSSHQHASQHGSVPIRLERPPGSGHPGVPGVQP